MFPREYRPLKRPKLGVPDYYPQEDKQKEDELTFQTLYYGYRCALTVEPQDEVGSALKEFSQQAALLSKEQYISHLNKIVESKKRVGLVQDSQKKRAQVPKENFFPVPRRKEAAVSWLQDLASTKSLSQLSKKVPVFNKKEEIFDNLFEKDVPIFRAVWYIKMMAAYNASMTTETKLTKKKQQTDPSFDWTLSLTRYMQECVWRIVNKGAPPNWSEGGGTGSRHSSQSSVMQATPTGEEGENMETNKWHYMVQLSSCLYEENLLDRHEFLRWLVERIEEVKPGDTGQLQLYLPLVLKHLRDLGSCVSLARPLVSYISHRLKELYELDENMQKLNKAGGVAGGVPGGVAGGVPGAIKEEDDVFVEPSKAKGGGGEGDMKTKPKDGQGGVEGSRMVGGGGGEGSTLERPTSIPLLKERKASGEVEGASHTQNEDDEKSLHFFWCPHHTSLMLQLSCVVQTIAIFCPTAFVMIKSTNKAPGKDQGKPMLSPLSLLPMSLTDLPMPKTLDSELQKKILSALGAAETEIVQRNKAVEACWSSVAVSDLQTTSEGANIQRVLAVLDVLDSHSFSTCRAHNPITILYSRISTVQKSFECPLGDDRFVMLLCQWAVTPHRSGDHRPLVAARLLCQRQTDVLQGGGEWKDHNLDALDDSWEDCCGSWSQEASDFPFQSVLFKFLDVRAPLAGDLVVPLKATDPYFHLITFFAELINLGVFSYSLYLCTLIARGDAKSPVVTLLPFARDAQHHQREQDLHLELPLIKKPRMDSLDTPMSSLPVTLSPSGSFIIAGQSGTFSFDELMKGSASSLQPTAGGSEESGSSVAMIQERQNKLERLLQQQTCSDPVQLVTFPSPTNETSTSPLIPSKSDPFNFASPNSTLFLDDDQQPHPSDAPLNKEALRHLLYATYFPIGHAHLSRQELNKRAVVLYGVGRSRAKVEKAIKKVSYDVEHYFKFHSGMQTPVLTDSSTCKLEELMKQFRGLPIFEQSEIASSCEAMLRASLQAPPHNGVGGDVASLFPTCTQFVLVCELLETAGCIGQMLDLVVDVVACDLMSEEKEGAEVQQGSAPVLPLPRDLCLPVACLLHKYLLCLLLSQNNTTIVFERLYKVLDGVKSMTEISAGQRAVFFFLHCLYTSCSYLQNTYRAIFDPLCVKFGDLLVENYPPIASEHLWQRTPILLYGLTKRSDTNTIPSICNWIKTNQPSSVSIFVIDVFSQACQVNISSQTLYDLAQVCAGVAAMCGKQVNSELLGAFRALCLPTTIFKFCQSGYSQLITRNNILMNAGIHSSLITFVALLLATGCLLLHDIISYIIKPIISVQLTHPQVGAPQHRVLLLQFMNSLVLHLLVDDYIRGDYSDDPENHILLPPFVRHFLQAKCRDLDFNYIVSLVKDLFRISQPASRSAAIGSMKMGMQVLVQSSSDGGEAVLDRVKVVLESLATQSWVREKCMQHKVHIMDKDKLGDTSLTPAQAQYLLNLLSPYRANKASFPSGISGLPYVTDSSAVVEDILKNLDQWTLRNALLQINVQISQASSANARTTLMDNLAGQVIRVFEDSCGDEWLGQTIESCIEGGDGAYSPHVWLVTPLISQLPPLVLGRVLKGAGVVLGQGQWWNPETQEKRRSTRATSGVVQAKTGLQWQQPFLELVLACMRVQGTTHEELLGPLKSQLSNFLAVFEKEGMPSDEQSKTILYAALKLRLSLVGSMLVSISTNEASTLDWVPLIMQLLCSGAVDRQPDCSELFTNALDMLSTLLSTLPFDFYICFSSGGEDGKKTYASCVKRLKSELSNIKSVYGNEIRQLFPLTPKPCEVITVRTPVPQPKGSPQSEKVRGLRVQDTKEVSSWDVLEGVKNTGPLMLSWFGAVRMKKRMLKYEEQWKMVRLHTHQKDKPHKSHFVSLPDINAVTSAEGTQDAEATAQGQEEEAKMDADPGKQVPMNSGLQDANTASKLKQTAAMPGGVTPLTPSMPNSGTVMSRFPNRPPMMMRGGLQGPFSTGAVPRAQLVRTLQNVRAMNQQQQQQQQQNQLFLQQPVQPNSAMFPPPQMELYRQQQQQQLMRQRMLMRQQQYQFRPSMRMVAPQGATPMQLQQQLMGQQGGFPPLGGQQQPPPTHQQGMMMRQQPAGQFTGPQQPAPGFMPGRMF